MTDQTNHDHVSELLPEYVRDDLDAGQKERVEEHLSECTHCAQELAGLRALVGGEVTKMNDIERERLHTVVAEGLDPTEAPADDSFGVWLPPRKSRWSRFAPTLGAAALLLVAVIGALNVGGLSGGGDESGEGASSRDVPLQIEDRDEGGGGGDSGEKPQAGAPVPEEASGGTLTEDSSTNGGSTSGYEKFGPQPRFESETNFRALGKKDEDLSALVPEKLFKSYARNYTVVNARRLEDDYLGILVDKAPSNVDGRVRWCGNRVRAAIDEPILPAYGTLTQFDARRSLLLGFVYSEKPRGKLSNYMLWAWSDRCYPPFRHIQGTIPD